MMSFSKGRVIFFPRGINIFVKKFLFLILIIETKLVELYSTWLFFQFCTKFSLPFLNVAFELVWCACICATAGLVDMFFVFQGSWVKKLTVQVWKIIISSNKKKAIIEFVLFQVKDLDSTTLEDALALLQYPFTLVNFSILVDLSLSQRSFLNLG